MTVTLQEAFFPFPVLTVIVAVPFFLAVSFPPETVTTDLLLVDQVSLFFKPEQAGEIVALRVRVFFTLSVAFVLFSVTLLGAIALVR